MKLIAEYNPFLLDIEYSTMRKNPTFLRYISKTKTDVLCSWHDFKKTPSLSELCSKMSSMRKCSKYVKIVTTAKGPTDTATILALYSRAARTNLVAFVMGQHILFLPRLVLSRPKMHPSLILTLWAL